MSLHRRPPAKLTRPSFQKIVPRPRLFSLLDSSEDRPVTWVAGPPGSGKTSLISGYIEDRDLPCLWYQMDEGECDPAAFFHYLTLAAKDCRCSSTAALPAFSPENFETPVPFAHRFFETLFGCLPSKCLLVFDDYQEVPGSCPLHEMLRAGLSRVPGGLRVIVISRQEPPMELVRLRANGQLFTLGWPELRLTDWECREVVRCRTGQCPCEDGIRELQASVDGWAAGVILMLDGMAGLSGVAEQGRELSREDVFAYFAGEIVDKATEARRDFFFRSALLPRMTEGSARQLTGNPETSAILKGLLQDNLFINRRQVGEVEYQYHPLFRTFLLNRLASSTSEKELKALKQRAAHILEEKGSYEDALSLLQEAEDWAGLTRILLEQAPILVAENRFQTLESWLTSLPQAVREQEARLTYWLGVCRAPRVPTLAQQHFIEAWNRFREAHDRLGALLAWSGVVDTHLYVFASFKPLDAWLAKVEELMKGPVEYPSIEIEIKVIASLITAMGLRKPDHPRFETLLQRSRRLAEEGAQAQDKLQAYLPLAFCRLSQGRFQEVDDLMLGYAKYASEPGVPPLFTIMQKDLEAFSFWKTCRFEQCRSSAEHGLAIVKETGIPTFRFFLLGHKAAAALSQGDCTQAQELLDAFADGMDAARSWEKSYYQVMRTWTCLLVNDLIRAGGHAELGVTYALEAGENESVSISHLGKALVSQALGDENGARECLETGRRLGSAGRSWFTRFAYGLAEAQLVLETGDHDRIREKLTAAFELGRRQGYFNAYFWRPRIMSRLCALALRQGVEPEYIRQMIRKRSLPMPDGAYRVREWPCPVKVKTFGGFELSLEGRGSIPAEKKQQRPMELLKALLALGGWEVNKGRLCDLLWPDSSGDAAMSALSTNLQRLRRLLGDDAFVVVRHGAISLNDQSCWVDLWQLQAVLQELGRLWQSGPFVQVEKQACQLLRSAMDIHQGPFLDDQPEETPWAAPLRHKLQRELSDWHLRLGRCLEEQGRLGPAVQWYRDGQRIEPAREEPYQRLIICYSRLGLKAEAVSEYRRCWAALREHLACEPSKRTEDLVASIS